MKRTSNVAFADGILTDMVRNCLAGVCLFVGAEWLGHLEVSWNGFCWVSRSGFRWRRGG